MCRTIESRTREYTQRYLKFDKSRKNRRFLSSDTIIWVFRNFLIVDTMVSFQYTGHNKEIVAEDSHNKQITKITKNTNNANGQIVDKESKGVGEVGWAVYWFYLKACGGTWAVLGLTCGSVFCSMAW